MKAAILLITAIVILAVFNVAIYQKDAILQDGQVMLLKLAPVDPRSMMQGDYMAFRYTIEDEMKSIDEKQLAANYLAVIKADSKNVGHFVRLYTGEILADNEKLIKYHYQPDSFRIIQIKPDTFMFQEGLQPLYEKAAYAIFLYKGSRDYLLMGVADNNLNEITAASSN